MREKNWFLSFLYLDWRELPLLLSSILTWDSAFSVFIISSLAGRYVLLILHLNIQQAKVEDKCRLLIEYYILHMMMFDSSWAWGLGLFKETDYTSWLDSVTMMFVFLTLLYGEFSCLGKSFTTNQPTHFRMSIVFFFHLYARHTLNVNSTITPMDGKQWI